MAIQRADWVRTGALALALALAAGTTGVAGVAAQETPPAADEPATTQPVNPQPRDEGFDDWGLLGLLGLAGLAGLRRQQPEVRTVERTDARPR